MGGVLWLGSDERRCDEGRVVNAEVARLMKLASDGDTDAAAKLCGLAGAYLTDGETMPEALARHIGSALRRVADLKPRSDGVAQEEDRRSQLASMLGLTKPASRPRKPVPTDDVAMASLLNREDLTSRVAAKYDVSKNTARARIAEAEKPIGHARQDVAAVMKTNKLESLVFRRP